MDDEMQAYMQWERSNVQADIWNMATCKYAVLLVKVLR